MSTSSTIISSELPSAGIAEASNNTVLSYNDLTKLVHSGTLTVRDYVRKMLNLSATSMSLVVVSLLGYAIYRSYRHSRLGSAANLKSIMSSGDFNDLNSYMLEPDPDIGRNKRPIEDLEEIEKRLDEFKLSDDILKQIMEIMEDEMERGLNRTTATEADLKMLPTYVCQIPTGKESTDILALDLGGSNFRVLLIKLHENEEPKILNKVFIVSESIMKGSGDKLFSHIAHCLFLFMKNHNLDFNRTYPLGFTFSFPCRQTGLSHAILLRWTKGFSCSDVIGEDVVTLLQKAIDARNDIKVKVVVLINDTVGTLMSTAYYDKKTAVGLILGTGTNASYFESIDRIGTLNPNETFFCKEMIINTEWGAFGEKGSVDFIRSRYDEEIDKSSINVGKQIFEKMISGMYLGELARLIILDMIEKELIFVEEMKKNAYRHALFTKGSFYTKYLNEIETDSNFRFSKTRRILKELAGIENPSYEDCAVVKCICSAITRRAAKLTAAGLAVILKRMNKSEVTIAVDGSLFRYHPILHVILEDTLKNLVSPLNKFKIVLSVDGSGRGAAVVAAVAAEKDPIFKHNLQ